MNNTSRLDLLLGLNEVEKPTYISDLSRSMHTQVIGATGVGKTESALLPMLMSDIQAGHPVIFIDPKGDCDTYEFLREMCLLCGRSQDLTLIDLCNPTESKDYNPLKVGSPSELKDKIVGSIIWTEEFYKKVSERALLSTFTFLKKAAISATLEVVLLVLSGAPAKKIITKNQNDIIKIEYEDLKAELTRLRDQLEGLKTDLSLWTQGDFSSIIENPLGSSVLDWISDKKIVYVKLNTLAFEETSRRFGRLIVQDIKTAVQRLQSQKHSDRLFTRVYIDEFSSVASSGFIELLNKARSANVAITIAHQSLGDIQNVSEAFVNQILDNTNIKMVFRLDSPDSCDFFSRLIGTQKSKKETMQIQRGFFGGAVHTGAGTTRMTEEFIVSPNEFRRLGRGQAFVITKIPYAISKTQFKPISERMCELRTQEQKRRNKWPSFARGV